MNQIKTVLNRLFSKYLLVTNTLTCGGLLAVGDVVTQKIERLDIEEGSLKQKKHNWPRTGRMFCMGFVLGPFNHCWYKILDHILKGATGRIVVKKIMCDQAVAAPFFCSSFFMGMSIMEGKGVSGGVAEVKEKFLTVYMIDWCVWPPAQFINFYLLPTKFRVVYVATITFFWNTFLSWMKHREHQHEEHQHLEIEHRQDS